MYLKENSNLKEPEVVPVSRKICLNIAVFRLNLDNFWKEADLQIKIFWHF